MTARPLFYRRYPQWSIFGKIIHDGLSAIDLVSASGEHAFPGAGDFVFKMIDSAFKMMDFVFKTRLSPGADPPIGLPTFDNEYGFTPLGTMLAAALLCTWGHWTRLSG